MWGFSLILVLTLGLEVFFTFHVSGIIQLSRVFISVYIAWCLNFLLDVPPIYDPRCYVVFVLPISICLAQRIDY